MEYHTKQTHASSVSDIDRDVSAPHDDVSCLADYLPVHHRNIAGILGQEKQGSPLCSQVK